MDHLLTDKVWGIFSAKIYPASLAPPLIIRENFCVTKLTDVKSEKSSYLKEINRLTESCLFLFVVIREYVYETKSN